VEDGVLLTERFEDAVVYAVRQHAGQRRKGGRVPYASHVLGVASLVLDHGGDEDQAIAALLHDVVEDCGGMPKLEEISRRYGKRVARMVDGCTDSYESPKPPWLERKKRYLERLRHLGERGEATWKLYQGGRDGTLWYYRTLADLFQKRMPGGLAEELDRVVCRIEEWVAPASGEGTG
jgi:hypothetical protein